jgi:predicted SnoaL-like aldol condensation-catalyzing enzyme
MGIVENKANASRFLEEVINRGDVAVIDELAGPNFVDHQAPPGVPPTAEGAKGFIAMFRAAFPDLHYTLEDTIAEGDKVVSRATAHGTMTGDFKGMRRRASRRPGRNPHHPPENAGCRAPGGGAARMSPSSACGGPRAPAATAR